MWKRRFSLLLLGCLVGCSNSMTAAELFQRMEPEQQWHLLGKQVLQFDAHHPQGMIKLGDTFYLSSVEILERPKEDKSGGKRTTGQGRGYLFQFDVNGRLLRQMSLGQGTVYHPGGVDGDAKSLWVPVAEYRPYSQSIIYRVDLEKWQAVEAFRVKDHIGGIVYNHKKQTLIGLNWDTLDFYEWNLQGKLLRKVSNTDPSLAFQDCKFIPRQSILCGGTRKDKGGGVALVELGQFKTIHELTYAPRTPSKVVVTRNPMAIEKQGQKLRSFFLPEDGFTTLYTYEFP